MSPIDLFLFVVALGAGLSVGALLIGAAGALFHRLLGDAADGGD